MQQVIRTVNTDVLQQWIAALRGGEFQPGRYPLLRDDDDGYDYLGVLSELHRREHPQCEWQKGSTRWAYVDTVPEQSEGRSVPVGVIQQSTLGLIDPVLDWIGMGRQQVHNLNRALDGKGMNFAQIADYLEVSLMPEVAASDDRHILGVDNELVDMVSSPGREVGSDHPPVAS